MRKLPTTMDWIMCSPNSYVKALTPKVTVFGHGVYEEIIKLKEGHKTHKIPILQN